MKGVTITYGKAAVPVYRAFGRPLRGVAPVPESSFSGRENTLMAVEVDVEVSGENFLPAYTEGDNSAVVATDSMKNFILRHGLSYDGATLEGFLAELGHGFLETYADMAALRLSGRELRFDQLQGVLYRRSHDDRGVAELHVEREPDGTPRLADLRSGRVGLELLKVTGSSFTRFVRDEYTTLPERVDRPLFIHLDVHWRYDRIGDATGPPARATSRPSRCATSSRPSSPSSSRSRSSTSSGRCPNGCSSASPRSPRSRSAPRTGLASRSRSEPTTIGYASRAIRSRPSGRSR